MVKMWGEGDTGLHAKQVGGPARFVLPEKLLDVHSGHPGTDPVLFVAPYIREWFQLLELGHTREQAALQRRTGWNWRQAFRQQPRSLAHIRHQVLGDRCGLGWRGQIQRGHRGTLLLFHSGSSGVLGDAHMPGSSISPRRRKRPIRMRLLTVPSGSRKRSANSA